MDTSFKKSLLDYFNNNTNILKNNNNSIKFDEAGIFLSNPL